MAFHSLLEGTMPISREEAIRRLHHRWLSEVTRNPDIAVIYPLSHFLSEETINVVAALDLYAAYGKPNREHELVSAWLAPDQGVRQ
jgi:hypothetical protein